MQGRKGRGSIFVFAVGNGGYADDCCSFNGFVNSIYTIAITGVNKDGSVPLYGERCPGILAVTYSKEIFSLWDNSKVVSRLTYLLFSFSTRIMFFCTIEWNYLKAALNISIPELLKWFDIIYS